MHPMAPKIGALHFYRHILKGPRYFLNERTQLKTYYHRLNILRQGVNEMEPIYCGG